jgi:hypothetical protein
MEIRLYNQSADLNGAAPLIRVPESYAREVSAVQTLYFRIPEVDATPFSPPLSDIEIADINANLNSPPGETQTYDNVEDFIKDLRSARESFRKNRE